jgi:hypothetical protein
VLFYIGEKNRISIYFTANIFGGMMIPVEGYIEYKRREFCKDVKCPVQTELNTLEEGSAGYEEKRLVCKEHCRFTAHQFHYWLVDKGYIIIRPEE